MDPTQDSSEGELSVNREKRRAAEAIETYERLRQLLEAEAKVPKEKIDPRLRVNGFQSIQVHIDALVKGPGLWPEETGLPAVERHHGS